MTKSLFAALVYAALPTLKKARDQGQKQLHAASQEIRANCTWRFLLDGMITLAVSATILVVSTGIGIASISNERPITTLLVDKFQLTTLVAYMFLLGLYLTWKLKDCVVWMAEPFVTLLSPIMLYWYLAGEPMYYLALTVLTIVAVWRAKTASQRTMLLVAIPAHRPGDAS